MEKKDIIVLVLVVIAVGFNLYRRYMKKKANVAGKDPNSSSQFPSSQNDDDYEPYSKK